MLFIKFSFHDLKMYQTNNDLFMVKLFVSLKAKTTGYFIILISI